jgi:hypothetical protein
MTMLKSLTLAAATVLGLSTLASAAIHHPYRGDYRSYGAYYGGGAGTGAAARFQDQFKNTY